MRKQLILVAVVAMLAALAAPSAAKPSRNLIVGIFDEPNTIPPPSYEIWTVRRESWLPKFPTLTYDRDRS